MVNVPQVQIPDFAGTILRGEQVQLSRLQAMAQRQALDDASRFDSTLSQIAPALAAGQGPEYDSALGRLMGAGRRGFELALPLQQRRQQQREFDSIMPGAVAAPSVAPVSPVGTAPAGEGGFTLAGLATNTRSESGGDPNARPLFPDGTPRSSSVGPNQFIEGTWLAFANANPNLFQGMSRQQILDARRDPNISAQATQWYARQNAPQLQAAGVPVNDATLGLAHQFDGPVAARIFTAAPNTPIADVVGPAAMRANPDLVGQTTGQVVQRYQQRYAGGGAAPARDPNVTPTSAGAPPAGAPAGRGPNTPGAPSQEVFARAVNLAARGNEAAQRFVAAWGPFMRQADTTDSFREETRNIGGRQVQGQVNARTGQFTAYPGQTAGNADGLTAAQAAGVVQRLGPRIASGEIRPDSPEYNDYSIAHALMTRPTLVWIDDPNNPGTQRAIQQPGVSLDPTRFPPPGGGAYGTQPGVATIPTGGGATAPAAAPQAPAPGGVQIGATGMTADSPDATAANPTALTRQSPNTTPTGEENLSAGYARRMVEAETLLGRAVQGGYNPGNLRDAAAGAVAGGQNAGFARRAIGNAAMSDQGQLYRQAQEDWVRAKLRRESGAVIGEDEMAREIQVYFPQPGDSQAVIAQKAEARRVAIEAMRQGSGRAAGTVPREGGAAEPAQRRRAEEAIARARRELGPNATEDAILQRAAGFMR
jgi:hypothetical protein